MSTFKDVENANCRLSARRSDLEIIKKSFDSTCRPDCPPSIGRWDYVNIPEFLRQTFCVLLVSHFEEEVCKAEKNLEQVARDLIATLEGGKS